MILVTHGHGTSMPVLDGGVFNWQVKERIMPSEKIF
jgi:hypothetical protein